MKHTLKQDLIETLKSTPSIQLACRKLGVARATYYRWINDDEKFHQQCLESIKDGVFAINSRAEEHVLDKIEKGEWKAITYWLRHRHEDYLPKYKLNNPNE